jgi:hypothetical protein
VISSFGELTDVLCALIYSSPVLRDIMKLVKAA